MPNVNCPVVSTINTTPEFQAVKEKFGSAVNNKDRVLMNLLEMYRENNALEPSWYPTTEEDNKKFSDFIIANVSIKNPKSKSQKELLKLYNTMYTVFTPEQLRNRINDIAYRFWDCVNHLEQNDTTGKSRRDLIKNYRHNGFKGYKAILDYIFEQYDNWSTEQFNVSEFIKFAKQRNGGRELTNEEQDTLRRAAANKASVWAPVVENKDMLSALALTKIGEIEGFVVRVNGMEIDFSDKSEEDFTDGIIDIEDDEDRDENDGSKGDRYGDYRETRLMDTLSIQCRNILFGIRQMDASGNFVVSDLRTPKILDLRTTAAALKDIALYSTPDTFLENIKDAVTEKPWLLGVYNRLKDNSADTASVYSALKGSEITYITTILEKGRYKTFIVNSKARGKAMMAEAGKNISGGIMGYDPGYSIVDDGGKIVSLDELTKVREHLNSVYEKIQDFANTITILDDVDYNENYNDHAKKTRYPQQIKSLVEKYGGSEEDYAYLKQGGVEAMRAFLAQNRDVCAEIASHLRGLGFDVTAKNVEESALQSMGEFSRAKKYWGVTDKQTNANKLYLLAQNMLAPIDRAIELKKKNDDATGKDLYDTGTVEYSKINKFVALSKINDLEQRVVNEGKSLQTITNVNLLHQAFDRLKNMSKEDIAKEILPYEGMGLGFGDNLRPTGWLNGYTKDLVVYDSGGFNHREYGDMSVQQKMTNALLNYFMSPSWVGGTLYEVCIQSDYDTAYNFVGGPRFDKDKLVDMASDEVLIELERWASIQERIKEDPDRIKYKVYEEQGQKIHIFPELNTNGFIKEWKDAKAVGPDEALAVVKRHVREQLDKIAVKDAAYFEKKGVFNNKYLKSVPQSINDKNPLNFYSEDGTFDKLDESAKDAFLLMSMNYYYARQQITKITVGDLSHFDGLSDFEKRNMLIHAPHTSLYARSTNKYNGKLAGDKSQRVLYVDDDKQRSYYIGFVKEALKRLKDKGIITAEQFNNMVKSYENIKCTDGQGFRTLESRRAVDIASGQWSDQKEEAYWRIMNSDPLSSDIQLFFNPEKPVYTGYETIPAARGEHQKPVRATVLHKYSEVILLPDSLIDQTIQMQSIPMRALSKAAKKNGVDLVLFTSGVKVGAFSVVTPFEKKDGKRIIPDENDMIEYISEQIAKYPSAIHDLDYEGFGIAASIAGHGEDDKISMSTQAEKEGFADIEEGETAIIDGKEMKSSDIRKIYYQTKAQDIKEMFAELQKLFGNSRELEKVLNEEIKSKPYYSREMVFAIEQLKEGGTAMPMFSPNIRHNLEQLMASIINKRLTKPRYPGANLPEASSLGIDMDSAAFESDELTNDFPELEIKYSAGADGVRREYIETYTTIYDSAFEIYADENGVITPERLWGKDGTGNTEGLVFEGKIPREALEFIAYRTPSDYVHSLFNCKVKGFVAKVGGQVLYMPKDCMVCDGHDYDGDKKRCHFPKIMLDWDIDKMQEAYKGNEDYVTFEKFAEGLKSKKNIDRDKYRKIVCEKYDFSKPASENSMTQRYNGRIQMLFSILASPAGTSRASIPGEFEETKVLAKTMYILRNLDNVTSGKLMDIVSAHKNTLDLYNYLTSLSDKEISELVNEINQNVSPFSMSHAADAYEYIMGPADMIAIYAMYGSTAMMLQRANLYYAPKLTENGKQYEVSIFGHRIDKLYQVRDRNNNYASIGRSHLLNAAVDNPKDAVLGFLNQTPKLAALTNFLQAAGFSEEDIHLMMNQPAILELSERAADVKEDYMSSLISTIVNDLTDNTANRDKFIGAGGEYYALSVIKNAKKDDFIKMLSTSYSDLKAPERGARDSHRDMQVALLLTLRHLLKAANDLSDFVRLVRPESYSGTIGTEVSDAIMKKRILDDFRNKLKTDDDLRIGGMSSIIEERGLDDDLSETELPEVIALNTAMGDNALGLFSPYFPEVRPSWSKTAGDVLDMYDLKTRRQKSKMMNRIVYEMVLWKLFASDSGFISGEIKDEQESILNETPKKVAALNKRISEVKTQIDHGDKVTDIAAKKLIDNPFLTHLTARVNDPIATHRLQFSLNGPAIEGMKDDITAGWNALMMSEDDNIRQLAVDLFKYNVFSNGLQYGMYEFSHFVPFSVLVSTPGYITALQNMMQSDFGDDDTKMDNKRNFIRQYCQNHWNDENLFYTYKMNDVKSIVIESDGKLIIPFTAFAKKDGETQTEMEKRKMAERMVSKPMINIRSGEDNRVKTPYWVNFNGTQFELVPATKLGFRLGNNQVTLQYNPQVAANDMTPIISPVRQYQGKSLSDIFGDSDTSGGMDTEDGFNSLINAMRGDDPITAQIKANAAAALGVNQRADELEKVEQKAEEAVKSNGEVSNEQVVEANTDNSINSRIEKHVGNWTRQEAASNPRTLYVFTDNTDRDSGSGIIPADSWYSKKYGEGHHFPTMTAAVVRGLENARPISTQRWYHEGAKGETGRWTDADVEEFKKVVSDELEEIRKEFATGKYDTIMFPDGDGLFNTKISNITKQRTPQLYQALADLLREYGFDSLVPEDANTEQKEEAQTATDAEEKAAMDYMKKFLGLYNIVRRHDDGTITTDRVPGSPANIIDARKQQIFVALNKKLREILREKGVAVGVLNDAEARLSIGGVTDFDTAQVTAEGLLEMIRIAEGYVGEEALPEEFAHIALEMLGHDNTLVQRLESVLRNNPDAMREAFGDTYEEYLNVYGEENYDKLVTEAAGKLVAKQLFYQQEIETSPIRSLIRRICDAIKEFFRKFRRDEIQNAIFEANNLASQVAQGMFGGKLLDDMSIGNIRQSGQYLSVKTDLSGKHDVLSKLLKLESKRLAILKKRLGPDAEKQGSESLEATKMQIGKLEASIENYKTEDAIVTYMTDSLAFLAKTEESLDASVNAGRKANDVCKKLNTVRDTLYSFSQAIDAVNDAIVDGEISDSQMISDSIGKVQDVLSRFYVKYERIAKDYFEKMLANVYGDAGVTVGIGKDRGRTITIKEMARKADADIGFMSRWFHSIADCNDFVLMAVDDTTRKAKIRGRQRAADVRPRIEKAVNDLIAETGSRDTSFMFEKKKYDGKAWCNGAEDDGKLHKTGYYIKKESAAYKNLKPSQKAFYDTFMEIKKLADNCVPESLLKDNKIIMLRKYTLQKVKDAEGIGGKFLSAWDAVKNSVLELGDDYDPNYEEVAVDFENNKVDRLPLKFLLRGRKEQYDDMTDDVASSLVAYVGMAFEYDEVNGVINILENAKYMASERDVVQRTGMKTKRETIDTNPDKEDVGISFSEPFTKKAVDSNAQAALEDFFQMHLYGHIHKGEGTFGTTRISKRKTVDTLNNITSLTQMAINIPQRIANVNTGMTQILIESVGKGHFNFKDLMWAIKTYMSYTGDRLIDIGKTDYDNKLSLFADKFDLHQNNGRNNSDYSKKNISRIINSSLLYAGLTLGEDALALCTSLAIAHNKAFNVKSPDGKIETLFDAYEVKYTDASKKTGAHLVLKSGYTMADGSSISDKIGEMRESFEDKYAKLCATMNFEMQGIYNLDDRSAIQQYAAGSLLIMYRKWIAPSLKRRYGNAKFNALKGEYEEGYHRTMIRFLWDSVMDAKNSITEQGSATKLLNIYADIKAFNAAVAMNWDKLSDYEKSNVRRAQMEIEVVTGLYLACALSGKVPPRKKEDDPNYKPTWWDRQVMSQLFRLRSEIGSQAPTPMMVNEALHIMRSPFAAMGPITSTLNGFKLLIPSTYFTDIKSGRYKGHTKAYKYFRELPIIAAYKKIENFIDPTPLINYYKNEIVY